ncbi:MAG: phosphatidylglycerophosphate synthetase [Pseudomonadota bacterium]
MKINVPNALTFFRVVLIPCFVGIYYLPQVINQSLMNWIGAGIFLFAAITDWLDGFFARYLNQASKFGAFFDPVADKLMVVAALLVLLELDRVNAIISLIIIGRELSISSLREWMATIGKPGGMAVMFIGKLKTTIQMIAILMLLYYEDLWFINVKWIGNILINIAALLTVISMVYYIRMAWPTLRKSIKLR